MNTKGKSTGLHKAYFNGSPANVGAKPGTKPSGALPQPKMQAPKGRKGY